MYICRHCGLEYMTDEAVMCPRCQAPKGKGNNFCPFCGTRIEVGTSQEVCLNCGVDMTQYGAVGGGKSKIAAGLLGIFLGSLGVHNFYLGYIKRAVVQLASVIIAWGIYFGCIVSLAFSDAFYYSAEAPITFLLGILLFALIIIVVRIWSFIEGILILCGKIKVDGKGRAIK